MKPVFKCDYCTFMGTEDEVSKHEIECIYNYDRKSCNTCKHRKLEGFTKYKCDCGKEIPEGKMYEFCPSYERNIESKDISGMKDLFGGLFGGVF